MRVRLEPATRLPRPPLWAVGIVLLWGGLVVWASASFAGPADAGPTCHVRRLTGVPCPTCGAARGTRAILAGRPGEAWDLNPLFFSVLAIAGALSLHRFVTAKRLTLEFSPAEGRVVWAAAAVLFVAGWAYVIWRQT